MLISDLTEEDVDLAIAAAEAVGDDRIQEKTQGQVTEESWTHGSAAMRKKWFGIGYRRATCRPATRSPSTRSERYPPISASICGNCRCSARRCGATEGCRYFPASAPSPPATRASAHSARLSAV